MFAKLCSIVAALAVFCGTRVAAQDNDTLRLSFTQHGLNEVIELGTEVVYEALAGGVTLPDIHIDTHVAEPLGHITLDLTDIQITKFTKPVGALTLAAPASADLQLSDIQFELSCGYKWRKVHAPHASDHGTLTADPSSVVFSTSLAFAVTNGTASVAESGTSTDIGDFTIHFDGKVAWLYNLLVSLFGSTIKTSISNAITTAINKAIDVKLNDALAKIPSSVHLGGGKSEIDIGIFLSSIGVGTTPLSYFAVSDASQYVDNKTMETCPHGPTATLPFVVDDPGDAMLQLLVADNCFTCVLWVASNNGALDFTLPAGNTSEWALLIPALAKDYPNHAVSIAMSPEGEPDMRCTAEDGVVGTIVFHANSSVVDPASGNSTYTHTLRFAVSLGVEMFIGPNNASEPSFIGNVTGLQMNTTVEDSAIGHIAELPLGALSAIVGPVIRGATNKVLNAGLPIPAIGPIDISSSQVNAQHDGFFVLSGNMTLNVTEA